MRNYQVYFQIFDKKMQVTILAASGEQAKQIVREKIIFHKICVKPDDEFNEAVEGIEDILDIITKKKP